MEACREHDGEQSRTCEVVGVTYGLERSHTSSRLVLCKMYKRDR